MKSLTDKLLLIVKFSLLVVINFVIVYTILNYGAVKELIKPYIFKKETQKIQMVIEKSIGEDEKVQELLIPEGEKKMVKKQFPSLELEIAPVDKRLIIPKIGVNVPIIDMHITSLRVNEWSEFEKMIQTDLKDGVVHYPGTADPGELGNMFITGHSSYYPWDDGRYKDVFARLSKLDVGDEYFIFSDQKKYKYKIIKKKEVSPRDVSVLEQPEDKTISTLMTCVPLGTALRRLIIVSELDTDPFL